jgi:hypothetical protein
MGAFTLITLSVMAKKDRDKTKTIKQRAIYVYLPSLEMTQDWKNRSKKAGTSISKYVIERVEDSFRREDGEEGYTSRLELIERLRARNSEYISKFEDYGFAIILRAPARCYITPLHPFFNHNSSQDL